MLGFVSLNSSIDPRTSSESLDESVRPHWLKAYICTLRLIMSNDFPNRSFSNTSWSRDRRWSLSNQIKVDYTSSCFFIDRSAWLVFAIKGIDGRRSEHFEKARANSKSLFHFRNVAPNLRKQQEMPKYGKQEFVMLIEFFESLFTSDLGWL